jgi:hypothetical protein
MSSITDVDALPRCQSISPLWGYSAVEGNVGIANEEQQLMIAPVSAQNRMLAATQLETQREMDELKLKAAKKKMWPQQPCLWGNKSKCKRQWRRRVLHAFF